MAQTCAAIQHPYLSTNQFSSHKTHHSDHFPVASSKSLSSIPFVPLFTTSPLGLGRMPNRGTNFSDCTHSPSVPVNLLSSTSSSISRVLNSDWSTQVGSEVRISDFTDDKDSSCWLEEAKSRSFTTAEQTAALNNLLAETRFPTTEVRARLSLEIGMSTRRVQIWFQNRRQGEKKVARGEIKISSGRSSISPSSPEASTSTLPRPKRPAPYSKHYETQHSVIHLVTIPTIPQDSQRTPIPRVARPRVRRGTSPPQAREEKSTPLLSSISLPDSSLGESEIAESFRQQRSTPFLTPPILLNDLTVLHAPQTQHSAPSRALFPTRSQVTRQPVLSICGPKELVAEVPLVRNPSLSSPKSTTLPPLLSYLSEGANSQLSSFLGPIRPLPTITKTETTRSSSCSSEKLSELAEVGLRSVRWWQSGGA